MVELDAPPKDLLVWWASLKAPALAQATEDRRETRLHDYLTGLIHEGTRDSTLTQIAGYLHHKLADDEAVRHLVHQANVAQCRPPLAQQEVDRILDSILRREGAGHYRGVTPATLEYIR